MKRNSYNKLETLTQHVFKQIILIQIYKPLLFTQEKKKKPVPVVFDHISTLRVVENLHPTFNHKDNDKSGAKSTYPTHFTKKTKPKPIVFSLFKVFLVINGQLHLREHPTQILKLNGY